MKIFFSITKITYINIKIYEILRVKKKTKEFS